MPDRDEDGLYPYQRDAIEQLKLCEDDDARIMVFGKYIRTVAKTIIGEKLQGLVGTIIHETAIHSGGIVKGPERRAMMGDSIPFLVPPKVDSTFEDFNRDMQKKIAKSAGISYEVFVKDMPEPEPDLKSALHYWYDQVMKDDGHGPLEMHEFHHQKIYADIPSGKSIFVTDEEDKFPDPHTRRHPINLQSKGPKK